MKMILIHGIGEMGGMDREDAEWKVMLMVNRLLKELIPESFFLFRWERPKNSFEDDLI